MASALCIESSGSVGKEGPIVQIGSATGSAIGQLLGFSGEHLKVLVGCGAAEGISTTSNALITGEFFALEVILGDFSITTFSSIFFLDNGQCCKPICFGNRTRLYCSTLPTEQPV
jgi:CIC family chloride channel protein